MSDENSKDENDLMNSTGTNGAIIEAGSDALFKKISCLIEQNRRTIYAHASGATVLLFWEIGRHINIDILENKRADYGKKST